MHACRNWGLVALVLVVGCGASGDPQADAGDDFTVAVGDAPLFDGCGSSGSIDTYSWVIVEAPETMVEDAGKPLKLDGADCSYELPAAMGLDEVGTWVIELTVGKGETASTDRVTVEVVDS